MGRASRKGGGSNGGGGGASELRGHWSETHPDRHLWTEAQRVHAEMQTQAEYEALYGRGSPVEHDDQGPIVGSAFVPDADADIIRDMRDRRWSQTEVTHLLEKAVDSQGIRFDKLHHSDPLVEELWNQEWSATTKALENMGATDTLNMLRANRSSIQSMWEQRFLRGIEEQLELESDLNPETALMASVLDGTIAWETGASQGKYRAIQAELLRSMNGWADRDPDGFAQFAEETFLPALRECRPDWAQYVRDDARGDVADLLRKVSRSVLGEDGRKIEKSFDHLRSSDYFRGTVSESDWSARMLWRLALDHGNHQYFKKEWALADQTWEEWGLQSIDSSFARIGSLQGTDSSFGGIGFIEAEKFFESPLGQNIAKELGLKDSTEFVEVARHFNEDLRRKFWRGEVGLIEAWRLAQSSQKEE